jgi:hypothetical protein
MAGIEVDDITQGMAKYLLGIPEIVDLVGEHTILGLVGTPRLTQDFLLEPIESSESSAIVVSKRGGWTSPNEHNTANFPRMAVDIYVDPMRGTNNESIGPTEARLRANYIHKVVDKHLHIPRGFDMMWGDVRVNSSVRANEFDILTLPQGDGALIGTCMYNLSVCN